MGSDLRGLGIRGGELGCSADAECCSKMGEGDSNPMSGPAYIHDYGNMKFQHNPKHPPPGNKH